LLVKLSQGSLRRIPLTVAIMPRRKGLALQIAAFMDAVDWVERIPFAETRNYVQRVMENLQVYCARFGASTATVEPNLHRAAPVGSRANPVSG
jgi:hypothetical protein